MVALPVLALACSSKSDDVGRSNPGKNPDSGTGGHASDGAPELHDSGPSPSSGGSDGAITVPPPVCKGQVQSTLPGVSIEFSSSTKCVYTLAEAKAGITFGYELVIDHDVPDYTPSTYPYFEDLVAGLSLREYVSGGSQSYCLCDRGFPRNGCPEMDGGLTVGQAKCDPITLLAGRYAQSFTWQGENWSGPSDTANPKGAQFPAGDYQVIVKSIPGVLQGVSTAPTAQVSATLPIRLVP